MGDAKMDKRKLWTYGAFIGLSEAVGALSGFLTRDGMKQIRQLPQSALTPPAIVFPIVWAILYALMGFGAARVWMSPGSDARTKGLGLYVIQLIFNFFWSLFFFNMKAFGFSFLWIIVLWVLILLMTLVFRKFDPLAAWLQVPYLAWVAFAAYLNYAIWSLNR